MWFPLGSADWDSRYGDELGPGEEAAQVACGRLADYGHLGGALEDLPLVVQEGFGEGLRSKERGRSLTISRLGQELGNDCRFRVVKKGPSSGFNGDWRSNTHQPEAAEVEEDELHVAGGVGREHELVKDAHQVSVQVFSLLHVQRAWWGQERANTQNSQLYLFYWGRV